MQNDVLSRIFPGSQKLSHEELDVMMKFYFGVAEQFGELCVLVNERLVVLNVTQSFCNVMGIKRESILFKTLSACFNREQTNTLLNALQMPEESIWIELTGIEELGFKFSVTAIKNIGATQYIILFKKQSGEKHKYFESVKLHRILEQIPLSIVVTDLLGSIEYVNSQFEKITGYTLKEVAGKNPRILKSGDMPPEKYSHMWKLISQGKTWRGELHNRKKNGELFWEMASITGLKNAEGKIINFIAVKEDITTRKIVYQQMLENEEQLRFMVEATGDVLYKYSHITMKFEYLNPAIVKLTGYNEAEINRITLANIIQQVEVSENAAENNDSYSLQKVYGDKGDYRAEYLIQTKHGEHKWIEDHSFPWYNPEGELIGSVGILTDITERKAKDLELNRAKSEAESMNRLKSNFLANMSHELRTPLISILGYSEILRDMIQEEELQEIISTIKSGADRLTETINLILDLTHLESESQKISLTDILVPEAISSIIDTYVEAAEKKKIAFLYEDALKVQVYVKGEIRVLRQIFIHLLNNAIKYTMRGEVGIFVEETPTEVICRVTDTGIGIRHEDYSLIFEEFRQVSEGLDRRFEGSGLGLHITKRFVEMMGGKIWVESELGKGSKFYCAFPKSKNQPV